MVFSEMNEIISGNIIKRITILNISIPDFFYLLEPVSTHYLRMISDFFVEIFQNKAFDK